MKRIVLVIIIVLMLIPLYSCSSEFTFRGSRFGDSLEQVKQAEGDGGETEEIGGYQMLQYEREIYKDYKSILNYSFKNDELKIIDFFIHYGGENVEDVYYNIKETFKGYGNPTKEEALEYTLYQALWKNDKYGIFLLVTDSAVLVICTSDPGKAERFYSTYMYSGLYDDSGSAADTYEQVVGPDFYNDPYDISNFIPIPKEGYEYTVRNSISEEELSILKNNPSIQELINEFGYPPKAEIYKTGVMDNGKIEYVKEYYLHYFIGYQMLSVIYDKDCNLVKVNYDNNLTGIPETNGDLNIEKPIGVVRNDITRDELSFIDSETTPEELQRILGAPHRECYNGELFRRARHDFIRFLMSGHFLYPLKDGGVLDVHYMIEKGKKGLCVATACIYEDNGEFTVLADRYK